MLISVKVEKLVVAAIPDLVDTWTKGFGFELVEESEKRSLSKINFMVFPGTVLLKKTLYSEHFFYRSFSCCFSYKIQSIGIGNVNWKENRMGNV